MSKLRITLACWDYDRARALADGEVEAEGIDLNVLALPVEETFFRMLRHREFDAAEMSLSSYTVSLTRDNPAFIAIPVFPSRLFRHNGIFISTKSGIREPKDLIGKRIGVPEYQLTAPVWQRGILQDEYGVDPTSVEYFTGGEEEPGREEKVPLSLPPKFRVRAIAPDKTLSHMLAEGEIDAITAPRNPSTFVTRPDRVQRLFPNFIDVEKAYFRKTRIFPIMHTVVLRRDLYAANPWIAQSLTKAFFESKRRAAENLAIVAAIKTMLPWQIAYLEETRRELGDDWWPYGFEANRHVLDTFLRYHHEQGLSPKRFKPEDLFAPETFDSFKIRPRRPAPRGHAAAAARRRRRARSAYDRASSRFFFPGALVFPGGVLDDADRRAGDPPDMAFRRAAIRETFEEVGLSLAGTDLLVPFAHWVTPVRSPKRYDTIFFLARPPLDQVHRHDGHEAVDSLWIAPDAAIAEDAAKRRRLVFATRLNLMRLARSADAAAALADAAASVHLITPICPEVYDTPAGSRIRIPSIGHYEAADLPTPDQRHG